MRELQLTGPLNETKMSKFGQSIVAIIFFPWDNKIQMKAVHKFVHDSYINFLLDKFMQDFVQELPAKLVIPSSELRILDISLGQGELLKNYHSAVSLSQ